MKATTLTKAAFLAGSLSFLAGSAFSQTAVSGAGGYTTYNLIRGFNLAGLTLHAPIAVSGSIDSEAGATITDADPGDLTAILDPATTYLVEITSGPQAGAVAEIEGVTATTFDIVGGAGLGAGAEDYNLRAAATLGEVFDSLGGSGAIPPDATTDRVWVPNETSPSGFKVYYKDNSGAFRDADNPFGGGIQTDLAVFYPDGLFVELNSADTLDLVLTGMVKTTSTVVAANEGFNLVGITPPVGSTLSNSGLAATLVPSGIIPPDASTDKVWVVDSSSPSGFKVYYVDNAGGWRDADNPFGGGNQDNTALSSGAFIERAGGNGDTAGPVEVPPFYANL